MSEDLLNRGKRHGSRIAGQSSDCNGGQQRAWDARALQALAAEGVLVTIGARGAQALEKTAQEIQQATGSRVLAVPTDVTRAEDMEAIVAATVRAFGRIDILVNNAGGPPAGKFESFGDAQWQAAFELNLLSTVRLVRLVLPHMRKTGSGRIINYRKHIREAANRRACSSPMPSVRAWWDWQKRSRLNWLPTISR